MKRHVTSGHVLVEFTVCCAMLVIALLVPWEGDASVIDQLARSMGTYLRVLTFLLSIS
jgi:hypothetical protein